MRAMRTHGVLVKPLANLVLLPAEIGTHFRGDYVLKNHLIYENEFCPDLVQPFRNFWHRPVHTVQDIVGHERDTLAGSVYSGKSTMAMRRTAVAKVRYPGLA